MRQILDKDKRLVGYAEKNQPYIIFHQIPAPQGDELDDLVLLCAKVLTKFPTLRSRTKELQPRVNSFGDEVYNELVREAVRFWIQQGNLRSHTQMNAALTQHADYIERLAELGVKVWDDWKFNPWTLKNSVLAWYFGIGDAKRPPTKSEIEDDARRHEQEASEKSQREANERRRWNEEMAKYDAKVAVAQRKENLLKAATIAFFDIDEESCFAGHGESYDMTEMFYTVMGKRDVFRKFNRDLVNGLVDAGKSDEEIRERLIMMNQIKQGSFLSSVPEELKAGETRHYVTPKELASFIVSLDEQGIYDTHDVVTVFGMDGRFCVTVIAKTESAA